MSPPTAAVDAILGELLLSPAGRQDPYPRYRELREMGRVLETSLGFLVVTGCEESQALLRDPRFGKGDPEQRRGPLPPEAEQAVRRLRRTPPSLLFLDPPDHTRLRGLVSKAFTPRAVERMRPHVARLLDELLDRVDTSPGAGPTDLMAALAFPLPVTVIGEMLGVPEADRPSFQPWVRAATALLELAPDPAAIVAAADASDHMREYFTGLLAERRRDPRDDLLSALLSVEDGGDTLSEAELISICTLLFGAGFETTTNLIGNGVRALLTHPDECARLRADPALVPAAVEEILRWDSPVQMDGRMALVEAEAGEHRVPGGAFVVTILGAANRDPLRFTDPDRFDVARSEGPPLSFGAGIHYCLGQALARLEGHVVFERLLRRFPRLALAADTVVYRPSTTLRGVVDLPVSFG